MAYTNPRLCVYAMYIHDKVFAFSNEFQRRNTTNPILLVLAVSYNHYIVT